MRKHEASPGEEWQGALVSLPSYVTGEGEPYRPLALLLVDTATELVLQTTLVHPAEAFVRAGELFVEATGRSRHTPARLRVRDSKLAAALRDAVGEVELVVGSTPVVDRVAKLMIAKLGQRDTATEEDQSLIGPDMSPDDVAVMFAAAARLYRATPWDALPADECIGVSCDVLGIIDGALLVVGHLGQAYGFSLFGSIDAMMAYYDAVEAAARGEHPDVPGHIMLSYDTRAEVPLSLVREIARNNWDVADHGAYPSPTVLDDEHISRGFTRVEMLGVSAIMTALAELVETQDSLAATWETEDAAITFARTVDTPLGQVNVELRAPLLLPVDSSLAGAASLRDDELDDYAYVVVEALDRMPGMEELHLRYAHMLILNAARELGIPLLRITPPALHRLLFEVVPRTAALEPETAPIVIDTARQLMAVSTALLGIASAEACLDSLEGPALPARLAAALADTRLYSPIKAMILEGIRQGQDLSTEEGISRWVMTMTRSQVSKDTGKRRTPGKGPNKPKKPVTKKPPAKQPKKLPAKKPKKPPAKKR